MPFKHTAFIFFILAAFSHAGVAQVFSLQDDLFEISLQDLMSIKVVTATGSEQNVDEAPAIITVITKQQIKDWGISSVGHALSRVPGFYCQYDYISYNCGVRGINGGFSGQSKVIKVMINGQATAFRSDTNNYLGPELIPITAIEKLEIVRGPVSALYGANAFLGVVNIITSQEHEKITATQIQLQSQQGKIGTQSSLTHNGEHTGINYHFSAQMYQADRSGFSVPNTIPDLSPLTVGQKSQEDSAHSKVIYSGVNKSFKNIGTHNSELTLAADVYYTNLTTDAQWQNFGAFTQSNNLGINQKVALKNQFWRLNADYKLSSTLQFEMEYSNGMGAPTEEERLDVGTSFIPQRNFGFDTDKFLIKTRWNINKTSDVVFGLEQITDKEDLYKVYRIDPDSGVKTLATDDAGTRTLEEKAAYVQFTGKALENLQITLNARVDDHNIYGVNSSYRTGVYYAFSDVLSAKLLSGSSYKAPAATQLYAQPLFSGEVEGNEKLKAELAETTELQFNWYPTETMRYSFLGYQSQVDDKIEVVGTKAENIGAHETLGLEVEAHYLQSEYSINANVAWQETRAIISNTIGETSEVSGELFPQLLMNVAAEYKITKSMNGHIHYQYVSERRASSSNIELNGQAPYQLEPYSLIDMTLTYQVKKLEVYSQLNNVLDESYQYTGFYGVDIPGLSRTITVGARYEF